MIPYFKPTYWGNERAYLLDAFDSTWISGGDYIDRFENGISKFLEIPYCLLTSSGTTAIELAYLTLGLKAGDEILVPGFGFMALANVAINLNLKVKFVDVDINTWLINLEDIYNSITPETKAIAIIHTYGNVCDMEKLTKLCKEKGIYLIEDCAESLASRYENKFAGSFGDVSIFSYHATKLITTGEGGMLATSDSKLYEKAKSIRSHGLAQRGSYLHEDYGMNFRISNLLAAIGWGQLEHIDKIVNRKNEIFTLYQNKLGSFFGTQTIQKLSNPVFWVFGIKHQSRDDLLNLLKLNHIEARPGFLSPNYLTIYKSENLPISDTLSREVLTLPSYPEITTEEINFICDTLLKGIK